MYILPYVTDVELLTKSIYEEDAEFITTVNTDDYNWSKIINYLNSKSLIKVNDTYHEYRGDSRDIVSIDGMNEQIFPLPVDGLGYNPEYKYIEDYMLSLIA